MILMLAGVSGQCLGQAYSLEETLRIITGYGVEYIEIWPQNIPPLGDKISGDCYAGRDIDKAKELLDKYGVKVSAVSFSGAFDPSIADDPEVYAREFAAAVSAAGTLGAKFVNHYCFRLSLDELDEARLRKSIQPALDVAEKLEITLVLENEAHDMTKTPEEMLAVLRMFGSRRFKTNFDAANYYQAGCEGFPFAYDVLREHIAYVHIKNGCVYREQSGHSARYKGGKMTGASEGQDLYYPTVLEGAVNIEGLIGRLKMDGYDGFCVAEPHCPPEDILQYLDRDLVYLVNSLKTKGDVK
jgi:sugar phosphate isomerase/epimerase